MFTHARLKSRLFILFCLCVLRSVYAAPIPVSSFNSLSGSIIFGDSLNFKIDFRNGGDVLGYGPYVDVVVPFDTTNSRQAVNINSAAFLDMTISPVVFRGVANFAHPYAQDATGQKISISLASNEVFYTYRLPFLSFAATQPTISLQISASTEKNTTLASLLMKTRAGFTYGNQPVDNNPSIIGAWTNSTVSVGEYKTQVSFSSQNFMIGPEYIYNCTHLVTFRSGLQTINGSLVIYIPCGIRLNKIESATVGNITLSGGEFNVSQAYKDRIELKLNNSLSSLDNVYVTFSFYIDYNDTIKCGYGTTAWSPYIYNWSFDLNYYFFDPSCNCTRQYIPGQTASITAVPLTLTSSIVRSVDVNAVGNTPGDSFLKTITFLISDPNYCFDRLRLYETLNDGLLVNVSNFQISVYASNIDATVTDNTMIWDTVSNTLQSSLNVSSLVHPNTRLRGPISLQFQYNGQVKDKYLNGASIVHGTKLGSTSVLNLFQYSCNFSDTTAGFNGTVSSQSSIKMMSGIIDLSTYAIDGVALSTQTLTLFPSQVVTLRITYATPTTDFNSLNFEFYPPHPVFVVPSSMGWTASGIPAINTCSVGPLHTLPVTPTITTSTVQNNIYFDFGSNGDPANTQTMVDIMCTLQITDNKFPNDLQIATLGKSAEDQVGIQVDWLAYKLAMPSVTIAKKIAAVSNSGSLMDTIPTKTFTAPGTAGKRWTGNFTSSDTKTLATSITGADAGDLVTIALVLENTGYSPAYNVIVSDALGTDYVLPADPNIAVYNGIGQSLTYSGNLFSSGLEISPSLSTPSLGSATGTAGANIIVVTYDAQLKSTVQDFTTYSSGAAQLLRYSAISDGLDFANPDVFTDIVSATTTAPSIVGSLDYSSLPLTLQSLSTANVDDLAPGEYFRARYEITFPEGVTPAATFTVTFPTTSTSKIRILNSTITLGSSITTASSTVVVSDTNADAINDRVVITFGDVTNTFDNIQTSGDKILVYVTGLVANSTSRTASVILKGTLAYHANRQLVKDFLVDIVEPTNTLTMAGSTTNVDGGDVLAFTITVAPQATTNSPSYGMVITNTLPAEYSLVAGQTTVTGIAASKFTLVSGNSTGQTSVVLNVPVYEVSESPIVISVKITVSNLIAPGVVITNPVSVVYYSADEIATAKAYSLSANVKTTMSSPAVSGTINYSSLTETVKTQYSTSVDDLALGEELNFLVTYRFPEGSTSTSQLRFTVPQTTGSYLEMFSCTITSIGSSLSYNAPMNTTATITGGVCNFNLGTVINTPDNVANNSDVILVLVTSRVAPDRGNVGSATLKGSIATLVYQISNTRTSTINVEFVEPTLTLTKTPSTTGPVDADDSITITLSLSNPTASSKAPAYVITTTDTIPSSVVLQGNPTVTTGTATVSVSGSTITISSNTLTLGSTLTVTYTVKVVANIQTGVPFTLPGASSTYYSNKNTTVAKNYTATAAGTSISVLSPTFTFSLLSTSNPSTGSEFFNPAYPDLSVCETATLQVTLSFPEGRTVNPQVIVTMPVPFVQIQNAVIQSLGTSLTSANGVNIAYSDSNNDVVSDRLTVTFGDMTNTPNNIVNSNDNVVIYVTGIVLPTASETGTALTNTATFSFNAATSSSSNVYFDIVEPRLTVTLNVWNLYDTTATDDEITDGPSTNEGFLMPSVSPSAVARGFDNGDKVKFLATISHGATSKAPAYNLAITTLANSMLRFFNNSVFTNASSVITYLQDGFSIAVPALERNGGSFSLRYTKYLWGYSANVTLTETLRVQYGQCSNSTLGNTLESSGNIALPRKSPEVSMQLVSGVGSTTAIPAPQSLTIGNQTTVLVRVKLPEMLIPTLQLEVSLAKGLSLVALPTFDSSNTQSIAYLAGSTNVSEYGDSFKVNFTNVINTNTQNDQDDYLYIYFNAIVLDLPSVGSGAERAATALVTWSDGNDAESIAVAHVIEPMLTVTRDVNKLIVTTGENITALIRVGYSNMESLAYDVTITNPIVDSFTLDLNSVNITGNPTSVTITPTAISAFYSVLSVNDVTISFKARVIADVNTPLISVGQVTATYSTMPGDLRSAPISPFNASSVERVYVASPANSIGILYRLPGKDVGVMGCWNQSLSRTNDQYLRTHPGGCAFGVMQWDSNCIQDSFGYLSEVSLQLYVRDLVLPYGQATCLRVYRDNLYNSVWDEKTATYSTLTGMTANVLLGRLDITTNLHNQFVEIPLSLQDLSMSAQAIENLVIRQCPYIGTVPSTTNITHLTLIDSKEGEHPPQMILRYSSTCSPNTCVHGKCFVRYSIDGPRDFCACASGWMGNSCNIKIDNSCSNRFNSVELLATDNIPVLDPTSGFTCSAMELRIRGPLVYNRTHTVIYWMNNRGGNAMCDYPGYFWNKDFTNDCEDLWSSSLPWVIGNRCGFTMIDDPDWYIYETFLTVEHNDFMGDFRGYVLNRITRHVFRMQVRFPKRTTVTTTIDVYSSVNLLAAVTFQAYQVTIQNGVIELTTSLQWPFMLDLPTVTQTPFPLTATVSEVLAGRNCGTVNGTECLQKFKFVIDPNTACRLDGLYKVNFTVACNPALKGDCPLDDTTNKAQIAMNILSEDICSEVSLDIGLTAFMEPYEDEALTIKKNVFLPGQRVYFLANVTVTDNAAELSATNFTDFTFGPYTLVTAGTLTPRGQSTATRFERRGTNWVSLSFLVPADLNIPVDGVAPFPALGTLSVRYKYVNTDTQPVAKRFVFQDENPDGYDQTLLIETSVNLKRQDTNGEATPTVVPVATPTEQIKSSPAINLVWSWPMCLIALTMYLM